MRLSLEEKYISIKNLITPDDPLPPFVVITGLNGSGKTHLLKAINENFIRASNNKDVQINNIKFFDYQSLKPDDETIDPNQLKIEKEIFWNKLIETKNSAFNNTLKQLAPSPEQPISELELKCIYDDLNTILEHNPIYDDLNESQKKL